MFVRRMVANSDKRDISRFDGFRVDCDVLAIG